MKKNFHYKLIIFLVFLLAVGSVQAQQHSKVNSEQDCLTLYEGSFSCFQILAEKTNDPSFCTYPVQEDVSSERIDRCFHNVASKNGNTAACERFSGDEYGTCISNVAWELQDETICELIPEELIFRGRLPEMKLRDHCQSNIIQYKDPECSDFKDNRDRNECYLKTCESVECCQNIQGTSVSDIWQSRCIGKVSVQTDDLSLCAQSTERTCISKIILARETSSINMCNEFKDVTLYDESDFSTAFTECVGAVANANKDPDLCLEHTEGTQTQSCLILTYSSEACALIEDASAKDDCAQHIALFRSFNADDCNVITDPAKRRSCRNSGNLFPITSNNWRLDVLIALILLVLAGLSFILFRDVEATLPIKIGLSVVFGQRTIMLIAGLIKPISWWISLILPLRFLDMPLWFLKARGFFPSNWTYILFADIVALILMLIAGYIAYKKDEDLVVKAIAAFSAILISLSYILLFVFIGLLALASAG